MAAARVIHFGTDECHRLRVLRSVGYSVDDCASLAQLRAELAAHEETAAVCITEDLAEPPETAASFVRSCTPAPVVLFRRTNRECEEAPFDLVVDTLTPPQKWLSEIQELIAGSQALRAQSRELCMEFAQLRRESEAARTKSSDVRERSRLQRARNTGPMGFIPPKEEPPSR